MAKTRSMTLKENQDASSKKRFKTCDNGGPTSLSDLYDDILFSVMMQLGVFDFPAFSEVCKSWRSLALSNRSKFLESKPSMFISISTDAHEEDYNCNVEDLEGRSSYSILPYSAGRTCIGLTCGHLIFFGKESHDFWLLDTIRRHGVHFPDVPSSVSDNPERITAFLAFLPSKSWWVFVMTDGSTNIWFFISGRGTWDHVSSTFPIVDLHAFKGKIYTINHTRHLCELKLNPEPKLMLLGTKNFPIFSGHQQLLSSRNSLYLTGRLSEGYNKFHKLDFDVMNWVPCKWKRKSRALKRSMLKPSVAVENGRSKIFVLETNGILYDCLDETLMDG